MKREGSIYRKHWQPDVERTEFEYNKFLECKQISDARYKNKKGVIIPKLYPDSFDWSRWRLGMSIWREIGLASRYTDIIAQADVLRRYAVGYLPGDKLTCRCKPDETAVMFLVDDEFCWTHLRQEEFDHVFIK
jgi:hypothetical protein